MMNETVEQYEVWVCKGCTRNCEIELPVGFDAPKLRAKVQCPDKIVMQWSRTRYKWRTG